MTLLRSSKEKDRPSDPGVRLVLEDPGRVAKSGLSHPGQAVDSYHNPLWRLRVLGHRGLVQDGSFHHDPHVFVLVVLKKSGEAGSVLAPVEVAVGQEQVITAAGRRREIGKIIRVCERGLEHMPGK